MADRFRCATIVGLIVLAAFTASAARSRTSSALPALASDRAATMLATPASTSPARGPTVTIVTPKAGARIHGRTVRVSVRVRNFKVVEKQFQRPVAREGHVHFYLDVRNLPTTHVYPSPVHYHSISGTSYTWTNVSPGRHIVAVQLVGNDHVPLRAQVKDRVAIAVQ